MQMRYLPRSIALVTALVSLWFVSSTQLHAQCSQDARSAALNFLQVSYNGSFIGVAPAFSEMQRLLMDDGVPPAWPIFVTRAYRLTNAVSVKTACQFTVIFSNYGYITENDIFHHEMRDEVAHVWVTCGGGQCKVDMNVQRYGLPPHAGKAAVLMWLEKLRSVNDSPKRKLLESGVSALR